MANTELASERAIRASSTWVELVRGRAEQMGERSAYTFLADGEQAEQRLSYAELDRSARALAARLRACGEVGERALLVVAPGPDFVRAFFGCLYAGFVAVPVPLPSSRRGLPRLLSIVRDCRPRALVSTRRFLADLAERGGDVALSDLTSLHALALEDAAGGDARAYREPALRADTVAFLQYTSGSTGTPKGVVLSHANLLANEHAIARAFAHDAGSVVVGWLPPFHDMGLIGNVLQPIFLGAHGVHMTPQHFLADPLRWLSAVTRYRATTSGGPNFAYELCAAKIPPEARRGLDLSSWRVAFNGAEPVRVETLRRFVRAFGEAGFREQAFYPCYGLAEATLLVSGGSALRAPVVNCADAVALESGRLRAGLTAARSCALVSVGQAQDVRVRIVDPESRAPCAPGDVGEIWVAGASVAHGYWGRAEESESTFAARTRDGEGPYLRTGDLGAQLDGELYVTGRRKDLIIVRGRNLYPQDLEAAAAASSPATRAGGGAAFALEPAPGESAERVVLVQEIGGRKLEDGAAVAEAIRGAIAREFELALHAVVLITGGTLPRTTSGKVQRRATRERFLAGALDVRWSDSDEQGEAQESSAPASELERRLASIWEGVLGRAPGSLARSADFVRVGGDSLQATQIAARVGEAEGLRVSAAQLFETSTIEALARWIQDERARGAGAPARAPAAGAGRAPLSCVQERLWFLEQLARGTPAYHVAGALRMEGPLDVAALERAVNLLSARHASLRTCFVRDADGVALEVRAPETFALRRVEAGGRELEAVIADDLARPFELERELPARFVLVRFTENQHALVLVAHHLVVDGWSTAILARELWTSYRAACAQRDAVLPVLLRDYADFAREERAALEDDQAALRYWTERFARPPAAIELPTDRPRGALQTYHGARLTFTMPAPLTARLAALGQEHGATLFMTLSASFAALLARCSGQDEVCLGTPVMVRRCAADEAVVGCFLNTLALRIDLAGAPSFVTLLGRVRQTLLEAQAHRELPFERVLAAAGGARDLARSPLFQVMIALQPAQDPPEAGGSWSVQQLDTGSAQFELSLDLMRRSDGSLRAVWEYNRDLFDGETVAAWAEQWLGLSERLARTPHAPLRELPWLAGHELAPASDGWSEAAPFVPVHAQFESVARELAEAEALVCGEERLSYASLNRQANQLARRLRAHAVGAESVVAIYLERSAALVVSALAVLKAGAAYLVLDPAQPAERARLLLADARVACVLTSGALLPALRAHDAGAQVLTVDDAALHALDGTDLQLPQHAQALAYVLFTSGSTGRPKGVAVPHAALAHTLRGWREAYGERLRRARVLSLASPGFDVWTADWVRALTHGGTLVMGDAALAFDPRGLSALIARERIELVDLVPAQVEGLLASWREQEPDLRSLRMVVVGSDAWSIGQMRALRARLGESSRLLSCYGLTETAIDSAWFEREPRAYGDGVTVPLGRGFAGARLRVLDPLGQLVPDGVAGELAISGAGLARGYLTRSSLTAERFVPDPYAREPGARMFRTGDRVRRDHTGTLAFLGRADAQLKLRGVRIEPGEIEACLSAQPGVRAACVALQGSAGCEALLVGYLVLEAGAELDVALLRDALRARLPEAMVPGAFVRLDALPLSAHGKVDRKRLPPFVPAAAPARAGALPEGDLERALAEIWRELLPGREIGRHDNFFDLGGHSLLLAQVQSRIQARLGREVAVLLLLQQPTIAALARALENSERDAGAPAERAQAGAGRRAALLARRAGKGGAP